MGQEIIQQLQRNNTQLQKISALNTIDELTNSNKTKINNSYLLLTEPQVSNYTIKFDILTALVSQYIFDELMVTVSDNINDSINTNNETLLNEFNTLLSVLKDDILTKHNNDIANLNSNLTNKIILLQNQLTAFKSEINNKINAQYSNNQIDQLINNSIEIAHENLQVVIDNLNQNYYTKEDVDELLRSIQSSNSDNLLAQIELIDSKITSAKLDLKNELTETLRDNYYTKEQINSKLTTQASNINILENQLNNKITELTEDVNELDVKLSEQYTNEQIDSKINTQLVEATNGLQSNINSINNQFSNYYTKSEINTKLNGINIENLEERINEVDGRLTQRCNDITKELNSNENIEFSDSRIDKLEKKLKYVTDNIYIDNISKVVWSGYSIATNNQSEYIIDNNTVQFTINKGTVMAYYNDETPDADITNNSETQFIVSTGSISGNTITLNNSSSAGNHTITVKYKEHEAVNSADQLAKINFTVKKTQYNNYFWIVDSESLNRVFNGTTLTNNAYNYAVDNSTGCPMKTGTSYNASSIILSKFYNNSGNIYNNALYIIIPVIYRTIISGPKIKINNKTLKSNIFEINIIGEEQTFTVNQASNIAGYSKNIQYSLIKISDTINTGIDLNIN